MVLIIISIIAIGFGVYWYFIHVPNYTGYSTNKKSDLKRFMDPYKLQELILNSQDEIWLIDVREEEYFLMGHMPSARNIPYDQIESLYSQIPLGKKLILYCDLTLKTQNVINFLEEKEYDEMLNWGKYNRWNFPEVVEETVSL